MVIPTISTVLAQTVSKAFYIYLTRVKQTKKGTIQKLSYADTHMSQIPSKKYVI